ncbi:NAD-dependent deacetylase [candidate division KSB1 bacterium]
MFTEQLVNLMRGEPVIGILTGAGISAESGVPTFRGEAGMWKRYRPEELANFDAFIRNPELVWEWYQHRQHLIKEVKPNAGHYAIAEMERRYPEFYLITQNVDNLHRVAGSTDPIELHGNIMRNKCIDCGIKSADEDVEIGEGVPTCGKCGGMLRPDVVWYGEALPEKALIDSEKASTRATLFFSIGTSAVVQPAASIPVWAKNNGAYLVEINIEKTPLTYLADEFLEGKSGEILPELLKEAG